MWAISLEASCQHTLIFSSGGRWIVTVYGSSTVGGEEWEGYVDIKWNGRQ